MQRNLLLGAMQDSVATRLSGDYLGAFGELGRRFDAGGIALTLTGLARLRPSFTYKKCL